MSYAFQQMDGSQVHDKDFVTRFSSGSLSEAEMRRIGFGEVTCHPDLIERTKAEVAGCVLTPSPLPLVKPWSKHQKLATAFENLKAWNAH